MHVDEQHLAEVIKEVGRAMPKRKIYWYLDWNHVTCQFDKRIYKIKERN